MRCSVIQFLAATYYFVTDLAYVQRSVSHDVFIIILFQMSDCVNDQYGSSDDTSSDYDFDKVIDNPNKESDSSEEDESDEAAVDDLVINRDEAAVDDPRIAVTLPPPLDQIQISDS